MNVVLKKKKKWTYNECSFGDFHRLSLQGKATMRLVVKSLNHMYALPYFQFASRSPRTSSPKRTFAFHYMTSIYRDGSNNMWNIRESFYYPSDLDIILQQSIFLGRYIQRVVSMLWDVSFELKYTRPLIWLCWSRKWKAMPRWLEDWWLFADLGYL